MTCEKEVEVPDNDASVDDWADFFEGLEELINDDVEDDEDWPEEVLDELFGPEDK